MPAWEIVVSRATGNKWQSDGNADWRAGFLKPLAATQIFTGSDLRSVGEFTLEGIRDSLVVVKKKD